MSYSHHLRKVLVGGRDSLLQIWCPKTLKIEKESPKKGYARFFSIAYLPYSNVILTKSANQIFVSDTELVSIENYFLPVYDVERNSAAAEFYEISKELPLCDLSVSQAKKTLSPES